MSNEEENEMDLNNDGKTTKLEMDISTTRFKNRRRMAWLAMWSMVATTVIMMTDFIDIERLKAIDNVIEMYYIAMASVVGAYMGFTTWASKS